MSDFTDEDRARVREIARRLEWAGPRPVDEGELEGPWLTVDESDAAVAALTRALAHIDHLERLQRADAMPTITLTRDEAWQIREGLFAEPGGLVPVEAMDLLLDKLNAILEPASKGEDE